MSRIISKTTNFLRGSFCGTDPMDIPEDGAYSIVNAEMNQSLGIVSSMPKDKWVDTITNTEIPIDTSMKVMDSYIYKYDNYQIQLIIYRTTSDNYTMCIIYECGTDVQKYNVTIAPADSYTFIQSPDGSVRIIAKSGNAVKNYYFKWGGYKRLAYTKHTLEAPLYIFEENKIDTMLYDGAISNVVVSGDYSYAIAEGGHYILKCKNNVNGIESIRESYSYTYFTHPVRIRISSGFLMVLDDIEKRIKIINAGYLFGTSDELVKDLDLCTIFSGISTYSIIPNYMLMDFDGMFEYLTFTFAFIYEGSDRSLLGMFKYGISSGTTTQMIVYQLNDVIEESGWQNSYSNRHFTDGLSYGAGYIPRMETGGTDTTGATNWWASGRLNMSYDNNGTRISNYGWSCVKIIKTSFSGNTYFLVTVGLNGLKSPIPFSIPTDKTHGSIITYCVKDSGGVFASDAISTFRFTDGTGFKGFAPIAFPQDKSIPDAGVHTFSLIIDIHSEYTGGQLKLTIFTLEINRFDGSRTPILGRTEIYSIFNPTSPILNNAIDGDIDFYEFMSYYEGRNVTTRCRVSVTGNTAYFPGGGYPAWFSLTSDNVLKYIYNAMNIDITSHLFNPNATKKLFIAFSLQYDGYQRGALSNPYVVIVDDSNEYSYYLSIKPNVSTAVKRITGIDVWGSISESVKSSYRQGLYYLCLNVPFLTEDYDNLNIVMSRAFSTDYYPTDDMYLFKVEHSKLTSSSYEDITDIPEETPNQAFVYRQAVVGGGKCFASNIEKTKLLKDCYNYLFRSVANSFDMFNWGEEYAKLPLRSSVTGMGYYNGRVIVFDKTTMIVVNATSLSIEDVFEGIGCCAEQSVLSTKYGLFWADCGGIYLWDGGIPQRISDNINRDANGEGTTHFGWLDRTDTEKEGTKILFDNVNLRLIITSGSVGYFFYIQWKSWLFFTNSISFRADGSSTKMVASPKGEFFIYVYVKLSEEATYCKLQKYLFAGESNSYREGKIITRTEIGGSNVLRKNFSYLRLNTSSYDGISNNIKYQCSKDMDFHSVSDNAPVISAPVNGMVFIGNSINISGTALSDFSIDSSVHNFVTIKPSSNKTVSRGIYWIRFMFVLPSGSTRRNIGGYELAMRNFRIN